MIYDLETFFGSYRNRFGKITSSQVEGLEFLLNKLEHSKRIDSNDKRAYTLATIKWETANTFQPVTEYGSQAYLKSKKYYPYIGKGYIQLTWEYNYLRFGKALGIDLIKHPESANEKETAWKILEMGMTDNFGVQDPDFTSYTLEDFFYGYVKDYSNARKIINPKDYDSYKPIAEMAYKFYDCLIASAVKEIGGLATPRELDKINVHKAQTKNKRKEQK